MSTATYILASPTIDFIVSCGDVQRLTLYNIT